MPIEVKRLCHTYLAGTAGEKAALRDIELNIEKGEFFGIIGHTGSGKSTLLQHMGGIMPPEAGTVIVDGYDFADKKQRIEGRKKVGLVFQYPEYQLFEETVAKDIAFGPKNMKLSESEIDERVREAAALVGVGEELFERSPLELSGGQKRRVAIAGVIAMRPGVLILDEPTAGLDPAGCRKILETICDYREKTGSTVVIVSHSMDDVARIADRLIVFNHGSIRFDGTPEEVFSNPKELSDIGLSVPAPTQIAAALREQGARIEGSIYTIEQLLAALLKLKKEAGRNA